MKEAAIILFAAVFGTCLGTAFLPSSRNSVAPATPVATPKPATNYVSQLRRHAELGRQTGANRDQIREYLMLDARLSVQEGLMSKQDFESYTGQKY